LPLIGKDFVLNKQSKVMFIDQTMDYLLVHVNEVCFSMAMVISLVFYRQYRIYEQEAEREEMIDQFLAG